MAEYERECKKEKHLYQGALNTCHVLFHTLLPFLNGEVPPEQLAPLHDLFIELQVAAELEEYDNISKPLIQHQGTIHTIVQALRDRPGIKDIARSFHDMYFSVSLSLFDRYKQHCNRYGLAIHHETVNTRIAQPPAYSPLAELPPPYSEEPERVETPPPRNRDEYAWHNNPVYGEERRSRSRSPHLPIIREFVEGEEVVSSDDDLSAPWGMHSGRIQVRRPPEIPIYFETTLFEPMVPSDEEYMRINLVNIAQNYLATEIVSENATEMEHTFDSAEHIDEFRWEILSQLGNCPLCFANLRHCECTECNCQDNECFWRWNHTRLHEYSTRADHHPFELRSFLLWFVLIGRTDLTNDQRQYIETYIARVEIWGSIFWPFLDQPHL